MSDKFRKLGIDNIEDVPWGIQSCLFYQTKEHLIDILVPYFKAGLENNELCIWFTSQSSEVEEAKEAMRKSTPDFEIYLQKGQMEIIPIPYTHDCAGQDVFSKRVTNYLIEKLSNILSRGYDVLRITGDISWLGKEGWNNFVDYEKNVAIAGNLPVISLCTCSLEMCNVTEVIDIVSHHQFSLVKKEGKWERIENSGQKILTERKITKEFVPKSDQSIGLNFENMPSHTWKTPDLEFAEIISTQAIQSLMEDFYNLTHIPIGIIDLKGNVLVGVGWQEICTRFHRIHPETCKFCIESDTKLSSGISSGEFKIYRCKNNMWDIVTPIIVGGQHAGNIFLGQFFFEEETLDYELFRAQAKEYGFNEEYIAALEKVPRLSRKDVDTIMAFFMKLANVLSQLNYSNIKLAQSLEERDALFNAVRESEKRERSRSEELEAVLDAVPVAVFIARDPQVLQITGNRLSYEWLHVPVGTNFSKSAPEGERPEMFNLFKDGVEIPPEKMPSQMAATGKEVNDCELDIVSTNGEIRHVLGNARPLRDEQGNIRGSISAFIDITDRKRAEETLAFERSQLLSIFDGIDDVVYVTDPCTYEVLYANKAMKEKFGGELVGGICYREFQQRDSPCDFCTNPIILKERDKPYHWEYYNPTVDRYFLITDRIIKWPDGRDVRFEIAKDITERKKAEEALKEEHDNLEKLVEERTKELEKACNSLKESKKRLAEAQKMAHIGHWEWTVTTDKTYWSDELYRIFGRNPKEPYPNYQEFLNYVHPADRDYVNNVVKRAVNGKPYSIDYRIIAANGEERTVHMQSQVIFDERDTPIGIKGIVQDITERKKAENALINLEIVRKKEIHHRIKNNLQVISSLLDLQAEKFSNRRCVKDSEILNAFRESQNRIMSIALIHEELHEGEGNNTLCFSPYLEKLVENLFQTYSLGNACISLKMDLEKNTFFDMDTAVPLGIIVNELISNSLKHAFSGRDKGEIQIKLFNKKKAFNEKKAECSKSDEGAGKNSGKVTGYTLIVSDNGTGIPEEIDLENSDTLGLQLVNILVAQLDGEIELKRDKGTEFIIRLNVLSS